ncbi:MAG: O-antigen ligase family protein [Chloroflexota bacterium]
MRTYPWRFFGRPDTGASDVPVAAGATGAVGATEPAPASVDPPGARTADTSGPLRAALTRAVVAEPWVAPLAALILLCAPNLLVWPAALVGVLPSLGRLLTTGRLWRATPFDLPLLLLTVGALLGGYASLSRDGAFIRLTGLLAGFLLFAALREHAGGERALRRLVLGLLVAAVASSVLLLVLVGPFLLLERVPPLAAAVSAIDRWRLGDWFSDQDWLLQRYRFRASGVGALADVGLALATAALVGLRGIRGRVLVALSVPFFLVVLLVADNRGAMLAGTLTLGAMATVWRRRLLPLVPIVVVLGLLVLAFGPVDRGLSLKTLAQRFWFWENSVYLAREVPFTGAGLGLESVQLVYRAYFQPSYPPFSHAHNIYLQGLLEYGVFGLLGLLGLGLATLWAGWRVGGAGRDESRWTTAGRLAGFGMAMAMLTTGLTEIVLLSTLGGALVLAAVGLLAATTRAGGGGCAPPPNTHAPPRGRRPPPPPGAGGG